MSKSLHIAPSLCHVEKILGTRVEEPIRISPAKPFGPKSPLLKLDLCTPGDL